MLGNVGKRTEREANERLGSLADSCLKAKKMNVIVSFF